MDAIKGDKTADDYVKGAALKAPDDGIPTQSEDLKKAVKSTMDISKRGNKPLINGHIQIISQAFV